MIAWSAGVSEPVARYVGVGAGYPGETGSGQVADTLRQDRLGGAVLHQDVVEPQLRDAQIHVCARRGGGRSGNWCRVRFGRSGCFACCPLGGGFLPGLLFTGLLFGGRLLFFGRGLPDGSHPPLLGPPRRGRVEGLPRGTSFRGGGGAHLGQLVAASGKDVRTEKDPGADRQKDYQEKRIEGL